MVGTETPAATKMISRKYKFHVLYLNKDADFFEPSEILFGQIQC